MDNLNIWLKKWSAIIILVIILLLLFFIILKKWNNNGIIEHNLDFNNNEKSLKIERDSLLGVVYTLQANKINKDNIIDLLSNVAETQNDDIKMLNRILKQYKINKNDLESIINIKSSLKDSNITKIKKVEIPYYSEDSTISIKTIYEFNDTTKKLKIKGYVDISNNDLKYSYTYDNILNIIRYKKRKNIFSKTQDFLKITSDDINSNLNINDLLVIPTIYKNNISLRFNCDILNNLSQFNKPILYLDYSKYVKGFDFKFGVGLNTKKQLNFSLNLNKKIIEF